jgi:hypothetical protein
MNGIPFLGLVYLELDATSLKIKNLKMKKGKNFKQDFLTDESGSRFPWINQNQIGPETPHLENLNLVLKNLEIIKYSNSVDGRNAETSYLNYLNLNSRIKTEQLNFLFVLFSASFNHKLMNSFAEFWTQFNQKHKFIFAHLNLKNEPNELQKLINKHSLKWYTIRNDEIKLKLKRIYNIISVPKLVVLDLKTGNVLNNLIKHGLVEYLHEKCENNFSSSDSRSSSEDDEEIAPMNLLRFRFDSFDLLENRNNFPKRKPHDLKKLDENLFRLMNENLIDLSSDKKISCSSSQQKKSYYLLYFCSHFTSNEILFNNVLKFLNQMREKLTTPDSSALTSIKIVLISSDKNETDFNMLLEKYSQAKTVKKVEFSDDRSNLSSENILFKRCVLDFNQKELKNELLKELNVIGTPCFSLIDASEKEILCENLKIFILNSQLRDLVL